MLGKWFEDGEGYFYVIARDIQAIGEGREYCILHPDTWGRKWVGADTIKHAHPVTDPVTLATHVLRHSETIASHKEALRRILWPVEPFHERIVLAGD